MASLDDFSREVAERLFVRYPEWRALASTEQREDGSGYLHVEVAAPAEASAAHGLSVITPDGEVIVGFDYSHVH